MAGMKSSNVNPSFNVNPMRDAYLIVFHLALFLESADEAFTPTEMEILFFPLSLWSFLESFSFFITPLLRRAMFLWKLRLRGGKSRHFPHKQKPRRMARHAILRNVSVSLLWEACVPCPSWVRPCMGISKREGVRGKTVENGNRQLELKMTTGHAEAEKQEENVFGGIGGESMGDGWPEIRKAFGVRSGEDKEKL